MLEHDLSSDLGDILGCFYSKGQVSEEMCWTPLSSKVTADAGGG
jgi:hypothetical protein